MAIATSTINVDTVVNELNKVADKIDDAKASIQKMGGAIAEAGKNQNMDNLKQAGEQFEVLVQRCQIIRDKMDEVIDVTKRYVDDVNEMEDMKLMYGGCNYGRKRFRWCKEARLPGARADAVHC